MPTWFFRAPQLDDDATIVAVLSGDFESELLAPFRCVLDAGSDCIRVRACYGISAGAAAGPCGDAPPRCDGDTLLIQVEQQGAACHEGFQSCFFRSVEQDGESSRETEVRLQSPDEIYGKKS